MNSIHNCSGKHKERLFVGEGSFVWTEAFLDKQKAKHPNLSKSIIATELQSKKFERDSEICPECEEERLYLCFRKFFSEKTYFEEVFCSELCERVQRIQRLRARGVEIILGFDGTKIHQHPKTKGKHFPRVHWNCPHDGSDFKSQTLPLLIQGFFYSVSKVQKEGDRVHMTLAQTPSKESFYQGFVYDITKAVELNGYRFYKKRFFGTDRYPGYVHETTLGGGPAKAADISREFIFIKKEGDYLESCPIRFSYFYRKKRGFYVAKTDSESSDYSENERKT